MIYTLYISSALYQSSWLILIKTSRQNLCLWPNASVLICFIWPQVDVYTQVFIPQPTQRVSMLSSWSVSRVMAVVQVVACVLVNYIQSWCRYKVMEPGRDLCLWLKCWKCCSSVLNWSLQSSLTLYLMLYFRIFKEVPKCWYALPFNPQPVPQGHNNMIWYADGKLISYTTLPSAVGIHYTFIPLDFILTSLIIS